MHSAVRLPAWGEQPGLSDANLQCGIESSDRSCVTFFPVWVLAARGLRQRCPGAGPERAQWSTRGWGGGRLLGAQGSWEVGGQEGREGGLERSWFQRHWVARGLWVTWGRQSPGGERPRGRDSVQTVLTPRCGWQALSFPRSESWPRGCFCHVSPVHSAGGAGPPGMRAVLPTAHNLDSRHPYLPQFGLISPKKDEDAPGREMIPLRRKSHNTGCKIDNPQGPVVQDRELYSTLCDNLLGKRIWKRIDTCMCTPSLFSYVQLLVTPWTVAHQAPLSMGFPRQEYWSGLPCPPPGDLPNPGIEPVSRCVSYIAGSIFTSEPPGKPSVSWMCITESLRYMPETNTTLNQLYSDIK